ncbi:MAG: glycosyltransferase [Flavobacteriaceae bacterium]
MKVRPCNIGIIIPCYNEAKRLRVSEYRSFLEKEKQVTIYFVNDGSQDETQEVLESLKLLYPEHIHILTLKKNKGKAVAVQTGMNRALQENQYECLAYLDADLSTSLEECLLLAGKISKQKQFIFGSRIKKVDNQIQSKTSRMIIGRILASIISKMLHLSVYDTQCGCKIFSSYWAALVFKNPFLTSWLFDVEIFYRLIHVFGRKKLIPQIAEVPLKNWVNVDDSKVELSYGIKVWFDLYKIYKHYGKN